MRAKSFFYASLGILALAAAYHLGARTAGAQAGGSTITAAASTGSASGNIGPVVVFTANGDCYHQQSVAGGGAPYYYVLDGNVFSGPTPSATQTWGSLKAKYR